MPGTRTLVLLLLIWFAAGVPVTLAAGWLLERTHGRYPLVRLPRQRPGEPRVVVPLAEAPSRRAAVAHRRATRRLVTIGAVAVAISTVGVSAAAALGRLPGPAQVAAAVMIKTMSPFEVPADRPVPDAVRGKVVSLQHSAGAAGPGQTTTLRAAAGQGPRDEGLTGGLPASGALPATVPAPATEPAPAEPADAVPASDPATAPPTTAPTTVPPTTVPPTTVPPTTVPPTTVPPTTVPPTTVPPTTVPPTTPLPTTPPPTTPPDSPVPSTPPTSTSPTSTPPAPTTPAPSETPTGATPSPTGS